MNAVNFDVNRLQKLVKDVSKYLQSQDSGPWPQNKVSALDRALGEMARVLEKKVLLCLAPIYPLPHSERGSRLTLIYPIPHPERGSKLTLIYPVPYPEKGSELTLITPLPHRERGSKLTLINRVPRPERESELSLIYPLPLPKKGIGTHSDLPCSSP